MESIIARALEYTLKYWLKSFNRDQFKLQGRTAQLSNLDINGEALHASVGLPPALNVSRARVGKLEIILPSLSNVQVEPIFVQIDRLDLVLEEKDELGASSNSSSFLSSISSAKGTGYGFADKIADGMTIQIGTVNLLLETHGGPRHRAGAAGASPMASITMRNLLLYTTNESWEVVNLKEARDFSVDKKFIYVFKKLEWGSLSVDLLPHPDTFLDANFSDTKKGNSMKDEHGAKRAFFGGERLIEGISGEAYITIQRTQLNDPLGLEVQLHITEVVCPALSEPGLRALLRFFMGLYICINRGDVNPNTQQSAEAAGRSLVSVIVDHIFFCIKDTEFRLELLMQSLFCSRASVSNGDDAKYLTRVMIGGLFLRDTFSRPPCTLVQPSMQDPSANISHVPDFGKDFCPPIYPLGDLQLQLNCNSPLLSLHFLQLLPTPNPPVFASRTVIDCQPLMINLQEESCLRIASFLADGIAVDSGSVLPDFSINSLVFKLKGIDVISHLEVRESESPSKGHEMSIQSSFAGARLHVEDFIFSLSPSLKLQLLNLEKDPACFCLWKNQPVDASQKKLAAEASLISLSLEPHDNFIGRDSSPTESGLWRCIEMEDICIEVAMVTADGSPLTDIPPPEGVVRAGVACQQYITNTSVEQLFFVLNLYTHFSRVSERIGVLVQNNGHEAIFESFGGNTLVKAPGDTAAILVVKDMQLRFLESPTDAQGLPLICFRGTDLSIKVSHRTLGGAMAISSTLVWESVEVDCTDTLNDFRTDNGSNLMIPKVNNVDGTECHQLRAVFWVQNSRIIQENHNTVIVPFLNIHTVHVIPYKAQDIECHSLNVSACITGVRLGGGMSYTESLLHRFGILGPDGGPGEDLTRGLEHLADGPLLKLFKASFPIMDGSRENETYEDGKDSSLHFGVPDDVDVSIEFKDWLFALEGTQEMSDRFYSNEFEYSYREERSWHTTFQSLRIKAKSNKNHATDGDTKQYGNQKYPIEFITARTCSNHSLAVLVEMDGLQILKPTADQGLLSNGTSGKGFLQDVLPKIEPLIVDRCWGVNIAADIVISEDDIDGTIANWTVENLKFSMNEPIDVAVKKDELQYLCLLCKSEVDSVGRIAAGVLRILKLEGSLGPAAISQLSNLGSGSIDRIFTPEKLSRGSSPSTLELSPSSNLGWSSSMEPTIASLEEAVLDSKMKCAAIATELSSSGSSSKSLSNITLLSEKLETIQKIINQLKIRF